MRVKSEICFQLLDESETLTSSMDDKITVSLYGSRGKDWGLFLLIENEGKFRVIIPNSLTFNEWRDFIEGKGPCSYNNFSLTRKEGVIEFYRYSFVWVGAEVAVNRVLYDIENELIIEPLSDAIREAADQGFFGEEIRDAERCLGVKGSEE